MKILVPWQEALYVRVVVTAVYIAAALTAFGTAWLNRPFASAYLLLLMLALFVLSITLYLNWSRDTYPKLLLWYACFLCQAILTYASHFARAGLRESGASVSHSFRDALYFSVTTWTTLGYGDFLAPPSLRLLTSLEALTGSIAMAIMVALAWLLVQESLVPPSQAYADRRKYKFTPDGQIDGMTNEGVEALQRAHRRNS